MTYELLADLVMSARDGLRDDWEWKDDVVTEAIVKLADQLADAQRTAAQAVALLADRNRTWCPVIEHSRGLKVDECSWTLPCWEHRRRALVARLTASAGKEAAHG